MESARFIDKHIDHKRQVLLAHGGGIDMRCLECGCKYTLDIAVVTEYSVADNCAVTFKVIREPDDNALAWLEDEV